MAQRIFGHIPYYPVGSYFISRGALAVAGLHRPLGAGISGSATEGAESIVLSGGAEDNEDYGDEIIYTGQGQRNHTTGKQTGHQTLTRGNLALAYNHTHNLPVRVIRGGKVLQQGVGFRYDGLYRVVDYWQEVGKSGYSIWRFKLRRIREENEAETTAP